MFSRKSLPAREGVRPKRGAAPSRPWLGHPTLWHPTRHSVPKAVAIGLFCGLIPGPFQMLGALLMAIPLRSNVPVAMFVTFYTNPLTIVPLYLIAYAYGAAILGYRGADAQILPYEWDWSLSAFWQWMLSLGKPLGIGLVALALTLAVLGYFITELAWRVYIIKAWRPRAARRRSPP